MSTQTKRNAASSGCRNLWTAPFPGSVYDAFHACSGPEPTDGEGREVHMDLALDNLMAQWITAAKLSDQ